MWVEVLASSALAPDIFSAEQRTIKALGKVAIDRCGWVFAGIAGVYGPEATRDFQRKKSASPVLDFANAEQRSAEYVAQVRNRPIRLGFRWDRRGVRAEGHARFSEEKKCEPRAGAERRSAKHFAQVCDRTMQSDCRCSSAGMRVEVLASTDLA